jgi:hypothetical protein
MRHPIIALGVVLAHALLIFPLIVRPVERSKPQPPVRVLIADVEFLPKITGHGFSECPNFYWGYGFKTGWAGGVVGEIAQGYAADRAGLRTGDVIEALEPGVQSGPGINTTFVVHRGQEVLRLAMVSEKICQR